MQAADFLADHKAVVDLCQLLGRRLTDTTGIAAKSKEQVRDRHPLPSLACVRVLVFYNGIFARRQRSLERVLLAVASAS